MPRRTAPVWTSRLQQKRKYPQSVQCVHVPKLNEASKRIVDNIAGHIVNGAKTSTTDAAWKILDYMKKEWSQPGQQFKWMATMGTIITVSAV